MSHQDVELRLREYCRRNWGLAAETQLGRGTDGHVWSTNRSTAVKVFAPDRQTGYENERDAYLRLKEYGWTEQIGEFKVPAMLGYDSELMVVEMDIMHQPPYVIDFAKSRLNFPYEFSEQTIEYEEAEKAEVFEGNWPRVKVLLADLADIRLFYLDPRPGNIVFSPKDRPVP